MSLRCIYNTVHENVILKVELFDVILKGILLSPSETFVDRGLHTMRTEKYKYIKHHTH